MQDVRLRDLELVELEEADDLRDRERSGADHGRPLRLDSRAPAELGDRGRGEASGLSADPGGRETMPVKNLRVLLVEAEVERSERRHRAGGSDAVRGRRVERNLLHEQPADVEDERLGVAGLERVRAREALREPHAADVEAGVKRQPGGVADDDLGRAAAEIDDDRRLQERAARRDAAEREQRLFLAREQTRRQAEALLDAVQELGPLPASRTALVA